MASKITIHFILWMILLSVIACASKPSKEEFQKIAIGDYQNLQRHIPDISQVDQKTFKFQSPVFPDLAGVKYLVPGDVEATDDEMFPYIGRAYLLAHLTNNSGYAAFVDQLNKMNADELYTECKQAYFGSWGLEDRVALLGQKVMLNEMKYKWDKKSKAWQKPEYQ